MARFPVNAARGTSMKIMASNGSPRKKEWNTVTLLEKVLEGAASAGAQTELVFQRPDLTLSAADQ